MARKAKSQRNNVTIFLLVFTVSCALFGGLLLYGLHRTGQTPAPQEESVSDVPLVPALSFDAEDARRLLIVTTDGDDVGGFVVVHLDPANTRIRTMALPKETVVTIGNEEKRLCDAYHTVSFSTLQNAIESFLSLSLDHYAILSYDDIESIVSYLGNGLVFTLQEDLNYRSKDGSYTCRLSGGQRCLTALQVTAVLRYPAWHDGLRQQANIQAELLAALINRYLTESRVPNQDADFSYIIDLVRSDIRISHFTAAKESLRYLSERNADGTIAAAVYVNGIYTGSGKQACFALSDRLPQEWRAVF